MHIFFLIMSMLQLSVHLFNTKKEVETKIPSLMYFIVQLAKRSG
ncbi:hypothetical protein HMPREF1043_0323 [Streptococcus anginosus subsp. whileyi CCUG 39159]|uniref:Uncharacterized protein n=1 Tax=Streptococcus anginosus subsp. whileyi CCUG 39159 TaxID=1095729 RepID=I0S4Z6_STRAP|nr:hypothetical protein HMPREF1043_0323 [Streptococcus anginosus subsp. whileyi CCUG 39159]